MTSLPAQAEVRTLEYAANGQVRNAQLRLPALPTEKIRGTAVISTGTATLGIDPEHPIMVGLESLARAIEAALHESGYGVVRPDPSPGGGQSASEILESASSLLRTAFEANGAGGRRVLIALSAAAPLMAIAASERPVDGLVLIAPPILEPLSNRSDRVELTLMEQLGVNAELATELANLGPMAKVGNATNKALLVHGAADQFVPSGDAIGWRASLAAAGTISRRMEIAFAGHDLGPDPCREAAVEAICRFVAEES